MRCRPGIASTSRFPIRDNYCYTLCSITASILDLRLAYGANLIDRQAMLVVYRGNVYRCAPRLIDDRPILLTVIITPECLGRWYVALPRSISSIALLVLCRGVARGRESAETDCRARAWQKLKAGRRSISSPVVRRQESERMPPLGGLRRC